MYYLGSTALAYHLVLHTVTGAAELEVEQGVVQGVAAKQRRGSRMSGLKFDVTCPFSCLTGLIGWYTSRMRFTSFETAPFLMALAMSSISKRLIIQLSQVPHV